MARTVAGTVRNGGPALFRFSASLTENLPCPPLYLPDRCYPEPPPSPVYGTMPGRGFFVFRMFSSLRRPFLFFSKFFSHKRGLFVLGGVWRGNPGRWLPPGISPGGLRQPIRPAVMAKAAKKEPAGRKNSKNPRFTDKSIKLSANCNIFGSHNKN